MGSKTKIIGIAFILGLAIAFASGCGFQRENDYINNENYATGTEGISINFIKQSIPETIYAGDKLDLQLEVKNKGAYDNPAGKIVIYGFDKDKMYYSETEKELPELMGKKPTAMSGGYDIVTFEAGNPIELEGSSYSPTVIASACYYYETIATTPVCVADTPINPLKDDVICKPGTTMLKSQGAPVAVTAIKESISDNMLHFIVEIKNTGKGTVVSPDFESYDRCPFLEKDDIDKVKVEIKVNGLGSPEYEPEDGIVRLVDGKGVIYAKFVTRDKSTYESEMRIKLSYFYMSSDKVRLNIEKIADK